MRTTIFSRLTPVVGVGLALSLTLAGCGSNDGQSGDQSSAQSNVQSGAASCAAATVLTEAPQIDRESTEDLPEITLGEGNAKPTMTPSAGDVPTVLAVKTLDEGDGNTVGADDFVTVNYVGYLWDGTEFDSSYDRGQAATFSLNSLVQGWKWGLDGTRVGDTVMMVVPPELGYGDTEAGGGAIPACSTLVFVVQVLDSAEVTTDEAAKATLTDEKLPEGLTIEGELGEEPQIKFADGAEEPSGDTGQTIVVAEGSGATITDSDTVIYNLVGSVWGDSAQTSYWDMGPQSSAATGTVFLGQKVGSRVVMISPSGGESNPAQVVVVDILGVIGTPQAESQ